MSADLGDLDALQSLIIQLQHTHSTFLISDSRITYVLLIFFPAHLALFTVEVIFLAAHFADIALVAVPATFHSEVVIVNDASRAIVGAEFNAATRTLFLHFLD